MTLTKESLQLIIEKQGSALRQYDNTLHFLCEAITGDNYELSDRDTMMTTIKNTPHYSALLQQLLKESIADRSREAFTDFLIDLDNVGWCIVPIGDIPYSYANNCLLFSKVEEAIHWLTTTNQLYVLSHPWQSELMVKHMHDIIKKWSPGIVLQIQIARQGTDNMLSFVVRSVMEGEGYSKHFISSECQPLDIKQFVDVLMGEKEEYRKIIQKRVV